MSVNLCVHVPDRLLLIPPTTPQHHWVTVKTKFVNTIGPLGWGGGGGEEIYNLTVLLSCCLYSVSLSVSKDHEYSLQSIPADQSAPVHNTIHASAG